MTSCESLYQNPYCGSAGARFIAPVSVVVFSLPSPSGAINRAPTRLRSLGRRTGNAFTRVPIMARTAGNKVIAASTAIKTTSTPPMPTERNIVIRKKTRPRRPIDTVRPEKVTARPAVAMVMATASSTLRPWVSSSRKRLTINSE